MGVALLQRTTRHIRLTTAGSVLLEDATVALDAITTAEARALRAGQGDRPPVIAVKPGSDGRLLRAVNERYQRDGGQRAPSIPVSDLSATTVAPAYRRDTRSRSVAAYAQTALAVAAENLEATAFLV
ncbi:hypothetical protein [Streptantibioticus ferralitis]|uniref:HTH lysR-type domain-containing protein n=1 Tax=Streptantibioticus ferralitis TaxID=236510 RepID=A0ABT5YYY1_9ACTN|nr:hypothetical protein [Streptantibioticus ferralitis]MDF2256806.1 hypothetical protein [Streptantibioticus ferralitis]